MAVRPAPSPPTPGQVSPTDTHVLSRLHALFNSHSHDDHSGHEDAQALARAKTAPVTSPELISPGTFVDRNAIKVLVVTWNMGDALPKGDLSVLLGHVPQYTAPPSPSPELPTLPVENGHPYHIVVIAGQECPTDSGVPRGLGGIMKGVHVRSGHRKEKEERRKGKEKEKEEESSSNTPDAGKDEEPRTPNLETDEDGEEDSRGPSPSTPTTATIPHKHSHPVGSKGWSTMLDDWFCGIVPPTDKAVTPSPRPSPGIPVQSPSSNPPLASPFPPNLRRSPSDPSITSSTEPLHIPLTVLAAPAFAHSPLARSVSSSSRSSSPSSLDEEVTIPGSPFPPIPGIPGPKSASVPIKQDRPEIVIPNDEPDRTRDGGKCYLHLVKERLMGMYLSIYVYKGCEHLIQGVDKDFVTAGLAGGRLGNKGGIGISLKLADHRFLFVNSHLAAHSTRVSARLANIAKIKAELRLDTFLPKDDPRNNLPDITDRFDTVFWCGDLNFRLELSRLHAEWLVEQKRYSEALMWDQLKTAMKDPEKNPFPGFEEHTIDFPPTFKYDVWRSIKATNRELKRSLRRRATLDRNARRPSLAENSPALVPGPNTGLSHVPEADAHEELDHVLLADRCQEIRNSDDDVRTIGSRRSFESTAGGYTSGGPSTAGTDAEDEDFATSVDASAYGSRHRAFEAAIKAKTKNLLSLVKMDKVLSHSPSGRRRIVRSGSKSVKEKPFNEFDFDSRRTSISSIGSLEPTPPIQEQAATRPSVSSTRPSVLPLGGPRRPSDASFLSSSPNQPITRRFSILKRTVSGRSSTNEGRSLESHDMSIDDIDENADNREGVYDTSKKQRVPSWCDRVLWKSQVTPDPESIPDSTQAHGDGHSDRGSRALNRLSHAFANLGGHLRLSMTRTGSGDAQDRPNVHIERPSPPSPPPGRELRRITSPEVGRSLPITKSPEEMESLQPLPERRSSRPSPLPSKLSIRTRSGSATHPLLDANLVLASPPAHPKITFDPALPNDADRTGSVQPRPRSNSDSIPNGMGKIKRTFSSSSNTARVSPPRAGEFRRSTDSSPRARSQIISADPPSLSPLAPRPSNPNQLSARSIGGSSHHSNENRSSFVNFFRDLPALLHVKSSPHHDTEELPGRPEPDGFRPRRHLRGEVACLHYGTIDDAGMRQLEGRSDHRPAIFSAAVYVGE